MLRNTFLAVLTVLAVAAVSQAATTAGAEGDGKTSISYDSATGAFGIQPDGQPVGLFEILSATNIFTNAAAGTLPPGGLGFDVKAAGQMAWAALPASAITANHNLGVIAAPGLTQAFLLNDLTLTVSGGFGTDNVLSNLVCLGTACGGGGGLVPDITPVAVGEYESTAIITRDLVASNGPITWSALTPTAGTPAMAATLTPAGVFSWDPAGSRRGPKGNGVQYSWTATATNSAGADTGVAITLSLIPEPATVSLLGLAIVGFVGLFRRR